MKLKLSPLLLVCSLLLAVVVIAQNQPNVRGRILRGAYPAVHVPVTVYNQSVLRSRPSVTGQDGMYYLYGIPPGMYYLEVWVTPERPVVYPIQVFPVALTDIPPLQLP